MDLNTGSSVIHVPAGQGPAAGLLLVWAPHTHPAQESRAWASLSILWTCPGLPRVLLGTGVLLVLLFFPLSMGAAFGPHAKDSTSAKVHLMLPITSSG